MGIGFVLFFWFFVFAVMAAIYLFLHFLAKENKGAADLKRAFQVLLGIGLSLIACIVIFRVGGIILDYFFPTKIFTRNFGFEPTLDVRIIEGSSFWNSSDCSAHLRFQASKKTIEKILDTGFGERLKKEADNYDSPEIKEILAQSESRYYIKNEFSSTDAKLLLAYDDQSRNAYLCLVDPLD